MDSFPDKIGEYRILDQLGHGGTGSVFLAIDQQTGQEVALKILRLTNRNLVPLVRSEIRTILRLEHPGIIRIFKEGLIGDQLWYSMELLRGKTLFEHCRVLFQSLVRGQVTFSDTRIILPQAYWEEVLGYFYQLCQVLAFIHGENIIHGDLKPGNILIRPDGQPVIVDFGLTVVPNARTSKETLHIEDTVISTLPYMAPELFRNELVDARIDLYSLGCMLYELLTGQVPFKAPTVYRVINAKLLHNPPHVSQFRLGIPEQIDALIDRLLDREPHKRPGFASDVARCLQPYVSENVRERAVRVSKPRPYLYRPVFVGRKPQLSVLSSQLQSLKEGSGGCVFLTGESGIGKTRLALEFRRLASLSSVKVLTGECLEGQANSFGAFRQPLHQIADYCRVRNGDSFQQCFGNRAKLLANIVPDLADFSQVSLAAEPVELPEEAARLRYFAYIFETITNYAAGEAVLIILDDLHWADELSLQLIAFLAEGHLLNEQPVLLLGTYRSEMGPDRLEALVTARKAYKLQLEQLTSRDISTIVTTILALEIAPKNLCHYLEQCTEGNPFFISEYLLSALDGNVLVRADSGHWFFTDQGSSHPLDSAPLAFPLPETLTDLVRGRLQELPPESLSIVQTMALLGDEVAFELLALCLGTDETGLVDLCEFLIQRFILEYVKPGHIRFVHALFREVTSMLIPAEELASLHRTIAQSMEKTPTGTLAKIVGQIAWHWEQAGEHKQAKDYYLAAARIDRQNYDHANAARHYRRYLCLAEKQDCITFMAWRELIVDVLYAQGRVIEAQAELDTALRAAKAARMIVFEGQFRMWQGALFFHRGKVQKAEKQLNLAVQLLESINGNAYLGSAYNVQATLHFQQGRIELAFELMERALHLHRINGDRQAEGKTLGSMASMLCQRGLLEEGKEKLFEALALHREVGDLRSEGIALGNLAILAQEQGQFQEALQYCQQALTILREIGDRKSEGKTYDILGTFHLFAGDLAQAQNYYLKSKEIHGWVGDIRSEWLALVNLANIQRWSGELSQAQHLLTEAESIVKAVRDKFLLGIVMCSQGFLQLAHNKSALPVIKKLDKLTEKLGVLDKSQLMKTLAELKSAQKAWKAKKRHLLFQGELRANIPEGILQYFKPG
ncbi:protein kinase [bacterium]|nr:protein kinase [bacterium]